MQITHEEAQRLIQYKVDNNLNTINDEKLGSHLQVCTECRSYFDSIKDTESVLRQALRKKWGLHPLPLQMDGIYAKVNSRSSVANLVTTRTAIIGIAFVMFAFITWQSMTSGGTASQQSPLGAVPLIPTPSTQYTATNTLQKDCQEIRYKVQEGDTPKSVARQFSVSMESILLANNLTGETFGSIRELVIPLCESTPTSTIYPPTFTITPILDTISTTPG